MPVKDHWHHWHRMVRSNPDNSASDASTRTSSSSASSSAKPPKASPEASASASATAAAAAAAAAAHASSTSFFSSKLRWRSRKPPLLCDGLGNDGRKSKKGWSCTDDDDEWLVAFRAYKIEFGATRPRRPSRDGDISPGTSRPPSLRETSLG